MDKAIAFRRHFPHWEVRCVIVLPRHTPNGKDVCDVSPQNKPDARQSPTAVAMKSVYTLELCHPLLAVPATASMIDLWQENGRLLGLELRFPDGHHTHLTFLEIGDLQTV